MHVSKCRSIIRCFHQELHKTIISCLFSSESTRKKIFSVKMTICRWFCSTEMRTFGNRMRLSFLLVTTGGLPSTNKFAFWQNGSDVPENFTGLRARIFYLQSSFCVGWPAGLESFSVTMWPTAVSLRTRSTTDSSTASEMDTMKVPLSSYNRCGRCFQTVWSLIIPLLPSLELAISACFSSAIARPRLSEIRSNFTQENKNFVHFLRKGRLYSHVLLWLVVT